MLERKNLILEELKEEHDQGRIHLFQGHIKEMSRMIEEEKDKKALIEDNQRRPPSSYRGVIKRTINRENCTLEELGQRDFNEDVKLEIQKMICEQRKNAEQQEQKMVSTSTKQFVISCRLDTDGLTHLIPVDLKTNKELLSLSSRTLCGQFLTRNNVVNFNNKTTCPACLRKQKSK